MRPLFTCIYTYIYICIHTHLFHPLSSPHPSFLPPLLLLLRFSFDQEKVSRRFSFDCSSHKKSQQPVENRAFADAHAAGYEVLTKR